MRSTTLALLATLASCLPLRAAELPAKHTPAEVAIQIDREIERVLAEKKIPASAVSDDAEFLRRVYLDLTGTIPTIEQAVAFLDSNAPDKRAKLIDELLASRLYGRHFGTIWHNRISPLNPENGREFNTDLFVWLVNGLNEGRPWSKTVSEMLLAEGEKGKNPAIGFYLSPLNSVEGYVQADRVAGSVAQLFLGVNLRCAQCHNHPFAPWTQSEFWGVAAFFGRIGYTRETKSKMSLTESSMIVTKDGHPIETARPDATILIPGKKTVVNARYLGGDEPTLSKDESYRRAFAEWLTSPKNEQFNKAAVNRLWAHCFARGLVNPVDDLHENNPASHPALLKLLAEEFAANGHSEKHILRCICNSKAYQRSSRPLKENVHDVACFSHMAMKQLGPEALYDAVAQVTDGRQIDPDLVKSVSHPARGHWLQSFSSQEAGEDATKFTHGVPQSLKMLNSMLTNARPPIVNQMNKDKPTLEAATQKLYLYSLSRRPTPDEVKFFAEYRKSVRNEDEFYRDVIWLLVNSSEFLFNH